MGSGGSKLSTDEVAKIAKTPVAYSLPLGAPNPVSRVIVVRMSDSFGA